MRALLAASPLLLTVRINAALCNVAPFLTVLSGAYVVSGDADGRVFIWDWKSCKIYKKFQAHEKVLLVTVRLFHFRILFVRVFFLDLNFHFRRVWVLSGTQWRTAS
jgi:hypothetical protein